MSTYQNFLASKTLVTGAAGFDPPALSDALAPFQADLDRWALRRGRAAIFADTGLGKTRMQVEWANQVHQHTGRDMLILAPLAVARQTQRAAAEEMGVQVRYCRSEAERQPGISITNYDMLHAFDTDSFVGVVLDESSVLKNFNGKTKCELIERFKSTPYRLCCSATPAPNDHTELGTHAEFLGIMMRQEMLAQFFVHDGGSTQDWRLKGHAEDAFWRWVCSWGAMVKRPSDLGYSDDGYILPPLEMLEHVIPSTQEHARAQGLLFAEPAATLTEQRGARRATLGDRVAKCVDLVAAEPAEPWLIWCELNDEADKLERDIPGAVQVSGADKPDAKEAKLIGFANGTVRVLITKPKIAGFGLNWQHAARMAFVGVTHSFEQTYQAIRREWRFGQKRPVHVHLVTSELEGHVLANLRRKEADAERMARELSAHTAAYVRSEVRGAVRDATEYRPTVKARFPEWLRSEVA
jgi:hypothetical protein